MMIRTLGTISFLALLAACGDGAPCGFNESCDTATDADGGDTSGGDNTDGGGIDGDTDPPPGTESPTPNSGIQRFEPFDRDSGTGYVTDVSYIAEDDTFYVDNIAFDGLNIYSRGADVSQLSDNPDTSYAVYDSPVVVEDSLTGAEIRQFDSRAIYAVSKNTVTVNGETLPRSRFAIVRIGDEDEPFVESPPNYSTAYGFGGFIYERNGGVELPTTGQARYDGEYAGIIVYDDSENLNYVQGDMILTIDFEDFNFTEGVWAEVYDREFFDINGNTINIGETNLEFAVDPNVGVNEDGEIVHPGEGSSVYVDEGGTATEVAVSGSYYAILSGDNAEEVVGVVVVEGGSALETGGFILYRE